LAAIKKAECDAKKTILIMHKKLPITEIT
jgi:hypothetical protein